MIHTDGKRTIANHPADRAGGFKPPAPSANRRSRMLAAGSLTVSRSIAARVVAAYHA